MKKIDTENLNREFNSNLNLARNIKENAIYLSGKFKDLRDFDILNFSEDTGVLYFIASYFASENLTLNDNCLIVSDMNYSKKVYVFFEGILYIFYFDKEEEKFSIEVLKDYKIKSYAFNYESQKHGIYIFNNKGKGFLNTDFNNVYDTDFKDCINPEISSITLKLDFVDLDISFDNSNLDIDSIIKYIKNRI